jgi:hypothetical protein
MKIATYNAMALLSISLGLVQANAGVIDSIFNRKVVTINNTTDSQANVTVLNAVNDSVCMIDKSVSPKSALEIDTNDLLGTDNCDTKSYKLKVWGKFNEINETSLAFNRGGDCTLSTQSKILGETFKVDCTSK